MADDVAFPRLVYRGAHDELGAGNVGENTVAQSADHFADLKKDGWRLTSAPDEKKAPAAAAKK